MVQLYNDAVGILLAEGWTKVNPASFTRGEFEVFFDTSHYVEIIRLADNRNLYSAQLVTEDDFNFFLARLKRLSDVTDHE